MRKVPQSLLNEYESKHPDAFDKMRATDRIDPFFPFDAYDEDKVEVSIRNRINEELTSYLILSMS